MIDNIKKPIRMCVTCKKRFLQSELFRYSITINNEIKLFDGCGRSIYLCKLCKSDNRHKTVKILHGKYRISLQSIETVV